MLDLFPFMSNQNSSRNNGRNQMNIFDSLFNEGFINNIIGQVMNSDLISDLTNELANDDSYNIEFKDDGEYYLIKGYLPGLNPKDISIDFEENKAILTIKNKRVYSNSGNAFVTVIQTGGNIVKTFYIDKIDVTNLRASFEDGLLRITIPKARHMVEGDSPNKVIEVDSYKVE